jgi:hypothetical protein
MSSLQVDTSAGGRLRTWASSLSMQRLQDSLKQYGRVGFCVYLTISVLVTLGESVDSTSMRPPGAGARTQPCGACMHITAPSRI